MNEVKTPNGKTVPQGPPTEPVTCPDCGNPYVPEYFEFSSGPSRRFMRTTSVCAPCAKKREEQEELDRALELRREQDKALRYWIPELYLNSDRAKIDAKNPKILALIDNFDLGGEKGLLLMGKNGMCKTRATCLLLERYCRAGYSIAMVRSTRFAQLVALQFKDDEYDISPNSVISGRGESTGEKSRKLLKAIRSSDVLLIDDIGKEKFSERVETELFDLLEFRTSSMRRTLLTSNLSLTELALKLSQDQGLAIVRRIKEFNRCVTV
jgi:DNA replication protein DnaC